MGSVPGDRRRAVHRPAEVQRALERSIAQAQAHEQIVVIGPDALPGMVGILGGAVKTASTKMSATVSQMAPEQAI